MAIAEAGAVARRSGCSGSGSPAAGEVGEQSWTYPGGNEGHPSPTRTLHALYPTLYLNPHVYL